MADSTATDQLAAARRFQQARRKVFFAEILAIVRGRSPQLLSFDAVQSALRLRQQIEQRTPETIPLDAIVGSVGRYRDFTREFLPKESIQEARWKAVDVAMHGPTGLPPIEVYQVGDVYFVRDGHHRVSVARANGFQDIEAYVTRLETPVPITPGTRTEDLALKAGYASFLRQTHLDELRPDADVEVTEIGSHLELLHHIDVHRHYLGLEQQREIPYEEAVVSWYDRVFLPVAAAIWASDIMEQFPERSAADLYLWVCRHREELARETGEMPSPVVAVTTLAGEDDSGVASRMVKSVKRVLGVESKSIDLAAEAAKNAPPVPAEDAHQAS